MWQCASLRGGGLSLRDSNSWEGTDTTSMRFSFSALSCSVALIPMCDWRLPERCLTKMTVTVTCLGWKWEQPANLTSRGVVEEGRDSKSNAGSFCFPMILLHVWRISKDWFRAMGGFFPGTWSGNAFLYSVLTCSWVQQDYPQWSKCHYWGCKKLNCLLQSNCRNEEQKHK